MTINEIRLLGKELGKRSIYEDGLVCKGFLFKPSRISKRFLPTTDTYQRSGYGFRLLKGYGMLTRGDGWEDM